MHADGQVDLTERHLEAELPEMSQHALLTADGHKNMDVRLVDGVAFANLLVP